MTITQGKEGELIVRGVGVSPGIAIGHAFLFARDAETIEDYGITEDEVDAEIERFSLAVERSERDLRKIASVAREKLGDESAEIFEAQTLMLRDDALYGAVVQYIGDVKVNAGFAVDAVMSKHRQTMLASDNAYFQERENDLRDVQERIVRHLRRGTIISSVEPGTIIIAETLSAADIVLFSRRDVLGCALDFSGATSHVSIMARSLNVPTVVGTHGISSSVKNGDQVVLDGIHGRIIVHPTLETLKLYQTQQRRYNRLVRQHKSMAPLSSETSDGHKVRLRANVEFREELTLLKEHGAEGIGLFRTEILFLMQGRIVYAEDEQFKTYRTIVEAVKPEVTTFRVLDLGGDKMLPLGHREPNPFLGWRGIRVLLDKPDLLLPQLRALLRASAFGPLRILLPMVTNLDEVVRFRAVLEDLKADMRRAGEPFSEDIPVGIMIEVPAVALMAEQFAGVSDFFSIGSNDLTQYTLAVDRGNDLVAHLYNELNPAVLALMKRAVDAARSHNIPIGICGEMAASPRATPILVGLGLDEVSASPVYLPEVKRIIRALDMPQARRLAEEALKAPDAAAVGALVEEWLQSRAADLAVFLDSYNEPAEETVAR